MRFAVEPWAPDYGSSVGAGVGTPTEPADVRVDVTVEVPPARWSPRGPDGAAPAGRVLFVDGVRRIDGWVWITGRDGATRAGIAASYAAGAVCCDGAARLVAAEVRRGLFSSAPELAAIATRCGTYEPHVVAGDSAEELSGEVQQHMGRLEALVAAEAGPAELVVVDGPLSRLPALRGAVGYVKSHRKTYLPAEVAPVVDALPAGSRTPLFVTTTSWSRYSWYLRLPLDGAPAHPWAGVVRCEASGDLAAAEAVALADTVTATVPAFASRAHKDPRAPQNLFPIAELERALRHRLGDPTLLYRALRRAAG